VEPTPAQWNDVLNSPRLAPELAAAAAVDAFGLPEGGFGDPVVAALVAGGCIDALSAGAGVIAVGSGDGDAIGGDPSKAVADVPRPLGACRGGAGALALVESTA
jgi:hypothetical protein